MDLALSTEQTLLQDSVRRFLERDYSLEARSAATRTELGFSVETWAQFAELGWLGVSVPEAYGGLGGGLRELTLLMESFGRGLVVEPYLATCALGAGIVVAAGAEAAKQRLLPMISEGRLRLAVAVAEPDGRYDLHHVATRAERHGDGWRLAGEKSVVLHADSADSIIVPARSSGSVRDRDGITLFLVPRDTAGLAVRAYPTGDGLRAAELRLDGVAVGRDAVLGEVDDGLPALEEAADLARIALSAEAAGAMAEMVRMTHDYLSTREQFGGPIGRFQVLQHRLVDMFMEHELAWSLVLRAAADYDGSAPAERAMLASAAKARTGKAGTYVGQQAVQLHGGIGMTAELPLGHYFKRLALIDAYLGNTAYHHRRFSDLKRAA